MNREFVILVIFISINLYLDICYINTNEVLLLKIINLLFKNKKFCLLGIKLKTLIKVIFLRAIFTSCLKYVLLYFKM